MKEVIKAKEQKFPEFHCIKLDKDSVIFLIKNKTNASINFGLPTNKNAEYENLSFSLLPGETFKVYKAEEGFKEGDCIHLATTPEHTTGEIIILTA